MSTARLTPCQKDTYLLVARLIREGKKKLEKQMKLNVRVDEEQLTLLKHIADEYQAKALGGEQPDLFTGKEGR